MTQTKVTSKKGRKIGRNKEKCSTYRNIHPKGKGKKIVGSKAHRHCGPLGYYMRYKAHLDLLEKERR